jgi:hypothetical protein
VVEWLGGKGLRGRGMVLDVLCRGAVDGEFHGKKNKIVDRRDRNRLALKQADKDKVEECNKQV